MSCRARRIGSTATVISFPWDSPGREPTSTNALGDTDSEAAIGPTSPEAIEREAFAKGFAQGERAGAAVANQRGEETLQRLTQTLEELTTLRTQMIHQTERQMVQLALAVARRVVHREVSLDQDLLIAMARVALDRLGESAQVTVRLHPDDYEATGAARVAKPIGTNVSVIADPRVARGGCRVESDLGTLDAGVDAQIQELARALLGDEPVPPEGDAVTIN